MPVANPPQSHDALAALRIQRQNRPPRRSWFGRILAYLLFLVVLASLAGGGWLLAQKNGWLAASPSWLPEVIQNRPEVSVARVIVETGRGADAVVVASGYLESERQAKIGARAAGRIEVVNVEEGSPVTSGEILAVLEHRDIDAALAAARAGIDRAKAELVEQQVEIARAETEFQRVSRLRESNSTTEAEYDRTRFQLKAAQARLTSLQAAVTLAEARVQETEQLQENMLIRAPFDGTVISKDAEVGESILPGGMGEASGRGSVVTIADLDHLQVDCDVKEDFISRVTIGAAAEVAVDAVPNRRYIGKVRKIIPMGDRARATIKVQVSIVDADQHLFPDMSATVYFLTTAEQPAQEQPQRRIFCDNSAIVQRSEQTFVWVVDNSNRITQRPVTSGPARDDRTEILNGLEGDERIVLRPPDDLSDGQLVKILE